MESVPPVSENGSDASRATYPRVVAVILNTNRRDDTLACLQSLRYSDYPALGVLVLDNASTDASSEAIRHRFPEVEVRSLTENKGYAGNNNVGIRAAMAAQADWILVLNEDTLLAPDCIGKLVSAGEAGATTGIVGPMVYHADEPDVIQSAGGRLDVHWHSRHIGQNEQDIGQFVVTHSVDWISGCAVMIRRATVDEIGLLDERFFYYWEETEWCVRARKAGWNVIHVPQAKLWHKGVQRNYRPSPSVTYYNTRNRFLFLAKHRAPLNAWLAAWSETLRTLVSWTVRPRWRSQKEHQRALIRGIRDFLARRLGPMRT